MDTQQTLEEFNKKLRAAIIQDQAQKKIRASGQSAESLRGQTTKDETKVFGEAYFEQQQAGRKPGSFPAFGEGSPLWRWVTIYNKPGFNFSEISRESAVFLVARKIAQKGTDIFLNKRPGLDFNQILKDNTPKFLAELAEAGAKNVSEEIIRQVKI